MNYFTHTIRYSLFLAIFILVTTQSVFASSIYSEAIATIVKQGEEFKVDVYLDTNKDSVNALEGKVRIPRDIFEVTDIQNGNSFVTFWIETPEKSMLNDSGSTTFSGIIPGGYRGNKGYLFSLVLKGKKEGQAVITLEGMRVVNTSIVDNIDKTESESIANNQLAVTLSKEVAPSTLALIDDTTFPEVFKPEVSKNDQAYDGKYFLVFVAQDKGVGISHYEVREGRWGDFTRVSSPYILKNQNATDILYVKAYDKKGNVRTANIAGTNWIAWYKTPIFVIVLLGLVLLLTFLKMNKRFRVLLK